MKYQTNVTDNIFYEQDIVKYLSDLKIKISTLILDDDFVESFRQKIVSIQQSNKTLNIVIDFSTFSSKLILSLVKVLFNLNANITILYTEGIIYHPTPEEYELSKNGNLNNLSQTEGVDKVFISPEYNGGSKEQQDFIICFPSFKAERTQSIITYIDDLILKQNDKKRLVWIIGIPHMEEPLRTQRKDIQIKINNLTENDKIYNVDTLNYKNTIQALEHIYNDANNKYHINISDLGSKMQSFGIALFANLRRDVTVYYSEPKKYNPFHYSEGIKTFWMIEIGNTKEFVKTFFKVGNVEIRNNS